MHLLLSIVVVVQIASAGTIPEVDRLFGYGADPAGERRALQMLERAMATDPSDYELLWRAARSYYYVGDAAPDKEKVAYYERGIDAGKRAVAQNPNRVEGHFWLGASRGGYCREKGGLTAFRNVKDVRTDMETVIRLDASYEEGSAYRALGEIDRQLPRLFGGNLNRAIATLERGLEIAPKSPEIKFALAEAYFDAKRKDDARRQLQESLQLPLSPRRAPESRRAQEKAQQLLRKLDTR